MADDFSGVLNNASQDAPAESGNPDGATGIPQEPQGDAPVEAAAAEPQQPGKAHAPNLRDTLAELGVDVPDDQLERLDKAFVHKAALQPTREKEKERLDQMEAVVRRLAQENQSLMARVQGNGQTEQPKTPSQKFLEELASDPENEGLAELLGKVIEVAKEEATQEQTRRLGPMLQQATHSQQEQVLDQYCENLVPVYGEGLRELWPQVKQVYRQYKQEQGVDLLPENILWGHPQLRERMNQLVTQKQQNARQQGLRQQAGYSMEGFAQGGATTPEMPPGAAPQQPAQDQMDTASILRRVSRNLSSRRSGQPLSVSG